MNARPAEFDDGLCVTHPNASWWTAEPTDTVTAEDAADMHEAAARGCLRCPVRDLCAATAEAERTARAAFGQIPHRPFGVLAGLLYDGTSRPPRPLLLIERIRTAVADGQTDVAIARAERVHVDVIRRLRMNNRIPAALSSFNARGGRATMRAEFAHGVRGGVNNHLRRGQDPCEDCIEAKRQYDRDYHARRKVAA